MTGEAGRGEFAAFGEFTGWMEAQGYPDDTGDRPEYSYGDMGDAFKAGYAQAIEDKRET